MNSLRKTHGGARAGSGRPQLDGENVWFKTDARLVKKIEQAREKILIKGKPKPRSAFLRDFLNQAL